uniref:Restriction endonuclease type IV Mrr domain-containing protein n=1 Tax=viral metagenome TaxID=1070528 RepID=A0A6C0BSE1_9ZZZZ
MNLNIQILNKEDIEYLNKIKDDEIQKILQTAITIGLKSIQLSEVKMDCHSYIDPLKEIVQESTLQHENKLSSIEEKLDSILHIKTNSSRKGRLSEEICIDILNKYYKSWSFNDVTKQGYEADCRATNTPVGTILYEFKNYDYNVNKDQITKFIRDLEHTNIKYGIFVSNTSGIVGKKNIEWEIIKDKLIVYVSNMGFNGYGCIIGTELLLSLINNGIFSNNNLYYKNEDLCDFLNNMNNDIESLNNILEMYTKHKKLISEQRIKLNTIIDTIEKNSFDCLLELNKTIQNIIKNTNEINSEKILIKDLDDIKLFINKLNENNLRNIYDKLFMCISDKFNIKHDNNNKIYLYNKDKLICYSKILKSKIELIFPIYDNNITLDISYEKVKNKEIIIEIKDDINLWNLISNKLK